MQKQPYHQAAPASKSMPGAGLPWELHPACALWPEMPPADLQALSDNIAEHGLLEPIVLTPDDLCLDGRNRALACIMAGVEPTTTGLSRRSVGVRLSRNKYRRHMTVDKIAMVAAAMVTATHGGDRGNQHTGGKRPDGPLPLSVAKAAEDAGVTKSAVKSAKVVLDHGTAEEIAAIQAGAKKVRPTADTVRTRRRALAPPAPAKPKAAKPAANPIDDVVREIVAQCADGEWRSRPKIALLVKRAEDAVQKALQALGKLVVAGRKNTKSGEHEYWIAGKGDASLLSAIVAKDRRIAELEAELAEINAELDRATAPAKAAAPATVMAN